MMYKQVIRGLGLLALLGILVAMYLIIETNTPERKSEKEAWWRECIPKSEAEGEWETCYGQNCMGGAILESGQRVNKPVCR